MVTVDAQHQLTDVIIDEANLEDYELVGLSSPIVAAAQDAGREVDSKAAALLGQLSEGRNALSVVSGGLVDVRGFAEVLAGPDNSALPSVHDHGPGEEGATGPRMRAIRR